MQIQVLVAIGLFFSYVIYYIVRKCLQNRQSGSKNKKKWSPDEWDVGIFGVVVITCLVLMIYKGDDAGQSKFTQVEMTSNLYD